MVKLTTLLVFAALSACAPLEDGALCHTDTECAELCPEGTRDLPPDHPDYCDGGPEPFERQEAEVAESEDIWLR